MDILHEVELGVMKSLFAHLVRILYAIQRSQVQELDIRYLSVLKYIVLNKAFRYRNVPTFGRGTIRRFTNNVSAMKKLAARNWEDLLQVILTTCHNLFPNFIVCYAML